MTAIAEAGRPRRSFLEFLATELAPREGRGLAVIRIAAGCALTVTIAMVFRIPLPTYMAYVVFLICKDERSATYESGLGAAVAITLAVALCLGLFMVDAAEPALRLPAMALSTFVAMYTARTFALGPVTYLAGFVLVVLQTLTDHISSLEALTRLTLWLWLVVMVPVAVAVAVNALAGQSAAQLSERTVIRVLDGVEQALLHGVSAAALAGWRADVVALLARQEAAAGRAAHPTRVNERALVRLIDALILLEVLPGDTPAPRREELARRVHACRASIARGAPPREGAETVPGGVDSLNSPVLLALDDAFERLQRALDGQPGGEAPPVRAPEKAGLFVADAFTNPAHMRFALKTTLAVMSVYAIYTLLDYPGLRTSIVTCFFVALGSLGESVHKLLLRIGGAVVGGLIAALCIVFLLPHLTDIGQLCVLIAIVAAGCAWVATSSERLSYAGMQIAFAFFLGILQGYAPATDLTVLRDRVAGILLGNVAITIVFSVLWPESARSRVRAAVADLLRAIAALFTAVPGAEDAHVRTAKALVHAEDFSVMSEFELQMLASRADAGAHQPDIAAVNRLAAAALAISCWRLSPYVDAVSARERAEWAAAAASCVALGQPLPPAAMSRVTSSAALPAGLPLIAYRADRLLQSEIENVVLSAA